MQLAIELNLFLKDEMSSSTSLLFEKGDNASSIIDNITSQDTYSIIETVRTNPVEHIEKLADKILNCRHVVFLGVQFSGIIAYDAHLRFSRLGIPCKYFNTECYILTYSYFADPQDVVIIFSYSGKTAVILEAADHIRGKGTFLASVTKNYNNELLEISDLHLYINSIDDPDVYKRQVIRAAALFQFFRFHIQMNIGIFLKEFLLQPNENMGPVFTQFSIRLSMFQHFILKKVITQIRRRYAMKGTHKVRGIW